MEAIYTLLVVLTLNGNPVQPKEDLDAFLQRVVESTKQSQKKTEEMRVRFAGRWEQLESGPYSLAGTNFVVSGPSKSLATAVLAQAESLREDISLAWLGQELPAGAEFTLIQFDLSDDKDEGLTLLAGPGRQFSGDNRIWLTTTKERAVGSTLAHEVAHVVINSQFRQGGLPVWADEGIASSFDDPDRIERRKEILAGFSRTGKWPSIARMLDQPTIAPTDENSYAIAVSLTDFFVSLGERPTFLSFIEAGPQQGWAQALSQFYGIDGTDALQERWQTWVSRSVQ